MKNVPGIYSEGEQFEKFIGTGVMLQKEVSTWAKKMIKITLSRERLNHCTLLERFFCVVKYFLNLAVHFCNKLPKVIKYACVCIKLLFKDVIPHKN